MVAPRSEYLVSHGSAGGFGRFLAATEEAYARGDRVVLQTQRGLEVGQVLCPTTARVRSTLGTTPVGRLLRRASAEDRAQLQQLEQRRAALLEAARALLQQHSLPVEVLDAELLLDGSQAILHYLAWAPCNLDDLVSMLTEQHRVEIKLQSLATPPSAAEEEEHGGCGEPGCGRAAGGGCTSCSSGGCSSCGQGVDLHDYFAHLRTQMEARRTPLL